MTRGFVDSRPITNPSSPSRWTTTPPPPTPPTSAPTHVVADKIENVEHLPQGRRRHRRAALPRVLAAQHQGSGARAARALARVPPRAARERRGGVRDGERPAAAQFGRVRGVQDGRRSTSSASRSSGRILNARRLRRPAAAPSGDRDRRPGRRDPWPTQTHYDPARTIPSAASRGGRSRTPSRGCRGSRAARTGTSAATPAPRRSSATGTSRTTAATASRCRTASTPPGSATSSPGAGGTSRPGRPTCSDASTGTGRRSRSAPSSTSRRRAVTSTRARIGRSRSARPPAA